MSAADESSVLKLEVRDCSQRHVRPVDPAFLLLLVLADLACLYTRLANLRRLVTDLTQALHFAAQNGEWLVPEVAAGQVVLQGPCKMDDQTLY
jgi:hypothetical protein